MKKLVPVALIAALGVFTFTSCKKSSSSSSSTPSLGTMTATIDGNSWSAANASAYKDTITGLNDLAIVGIDASGNAIDLTITGYSGATGTFDLTTTGAGAAYVEGTTTNHTSSSGSVVLTSASTTAVAGTFSFSTTDSKSITNGKFNVSIK